jgi:pullulanase
MNHKLFFGITLIVASVVSMLGWRPSVHALPTSVIVHYHRPAGDYDGWGIHVWDGAVTPTTWSSPLPPATTDAFGAVFVVPVVPTAVELLYVLHNGEQKDPGADQRVTLTGVEGEMEIWQIQGSAQQHPSLAAAQAALEKRAVQATAQAGGAAQVVRIHYRRSQEDYDNWGLHVWGQTAETAVTWTQPLLPTGKDAYGLFWEVAMQPGATMLNYIVHRGDEKDPGPDQSLDLVAVGSEIWLIQGSGEQYLDSQEASKALQRAAFGALNKQRAHWITNQFIAWPVAFGPAAQYRLLASRTGSITASDSGLGGVEITIPLKYHGPGFPSDLAKRWPHLTASTLLEVPAANLADLPSLLQGQVAIAAFDANDKILGATGLQIQGVLDVLYPYAGDLGLTFATDHTPTVRLWAPTARNVTLLRFADALPATEPERVAMTRDAASGVWTVVGHPDWMGQYYLFEVDVYVSREQRFAVNLVTDPYSVSLAANSTRSQIVDLQDAQLAPPGWTQLVKPALARFNDIVLYELHVRDFSITDESVPAPERGTFLAFTESASNGMQHLAKLAQAGITHIHLLPVFDIATIEENRAEQVTLDYAKLSSFAPDSPEQQALLAPLRDKDGFNWGYDPYHYSVPEGSYSTDPNGTPRIVQFRQMVAALNQTGLRVVMDVVYNHTSAAYQSQKSVLDRIVPGYYYRLDGDGGIYTTTCCPNTASESNMFRKLMLDSIRQWAVAYKVDGFRFDLMGHHMAADMLAIRAMLDGLTLEKDGVDGKKIYIYGEGWNFGEVQDNRRGVNATQFNLAGSGIGTFSDRLRDAVRGGNPFGGLQEQGLATGLWNNPNEADLRPKQEQLDDLLLFSDHVRLGLAGNLATYQLPAANGKMLNGSQIMYNGQPAGYALSPTDQIVYVSAHDNETLWDAIQYKAPASASIAERVQMQEMALSIVALSQGIPFFHAGDELLRSKSLDRDSYNSSDWFNRIDWTYQRNNWGAGLPPQDKNEANWDLMRTLLGDPALQVDSDAILASRDHFLRMIAIRQSNPLFRLGSAAEIEQAVRFYNTGPDQIPGLIVEAIVQGDQVVVVIFNATNKTQTVALPADFPAVTLALHPLQANQNDYLDVSVLGNTLSVPRMTSAVFVPADSISTAATEEAVVATPTAPTTPATAASPDWLLPLGAVGAGLGAGLLHLAMRRRKP